MLKIADRQQKLQADEAVLLRRSLKWKAAFPPISFKLQQNSNSNENAKLFQLCTIGIIILVPDRTRSELVVNILKLENQLKTMDMKYINVARTPPLWRDLVKILTRKL